MRLHHAVQALVAYVEYMTWIPCVINLLFICGSNVGKSTLKPCCKTDVIIMFIQLHAVVSCSTSIYRIC